MVLIRGRRSMRNEDIPVSAFRQYIIQKQMDIILSFIMVIYVGVMFRATTNVFSSFAFLHYKQVSEQNQNLSPTYGVGLMDLFTIFFYLLLILVFRSIIQELVLVKILENICRELRLSKLKKIKFIQFGNLLVFIAMSIIFALYIIVRENLLADLSLLWTGYPYSSLSFSTKSFYLFQLANWSRIMPDIYLKKIRKEETFKRVKQSILYLAFISALYITKFRCIGVVILGLLHIIGFTKRVKKILDITEMLEDSEYFHIAQNVHNWLFFVIQSLILILSQTVLWYGLNGEDNTGELCHISLFNLLTSVSALAAQAWIVYKFCKEKKYKRGRKYFTPSLYSDLQALIKSMAKQKAEKELKNAATNNKSSQLKQE